MTQVSKNILRNSINVFLSSTNEDKEKYITVVQKNLNDHKNAINSIGMGYCSHTVQAGQIFLRIFNN
jgi:hypothetical protein